MSSSRPMDVDSSAFKPIALTSASNKAKNPVIERMYAAFLEYHTCSRRYSLDQETGDLIPMFTLRPDAEAIARKKIIGRKDVTLSDEEINFKIAEVIKSQKITKIIPNIDESYTFVIVINEAGKPELRLQNNGAHFYLADRAESVLAAGEITFEEGPLRIRKIKSISDSSGAYHITTTDPIERLAQERSFALAVKAVGLDVMLLPKRYTDALNDSLDEKRDFSSSTHIFSMLEKAKPLPLAERSASVSLVAVDEVKAMSHPEPSGAEKSMIGKDGFFNPKKTADDALTEEKKAPLDTSRPKKK